jgi:hypothetical protein
MSWQQVIKEMFHLLLTVGGLQLYLAGSVIRNCRFSSVTSHKQFSNLPREMANVKVISTNNTPNLFCCDNAQNTSNLWTFHSSPTEALHFCSIQI